MSLVAHLLETRTALELAKELAATVKANAELKNRVDALEHDLFWQTQSSERKREIDYARRYAHIRHRCSFVFKNGRIVSMSPVVSEDWGKAIDEQLDELMGVTK